MGWHAGQGHLRESLTRVPSVHGEAIVRARNLDVATHSHTFVHVLQD